MFLEWNLLHSSLSKEGYFIHSLCTKPGISAKVMLLGDAFTSRWPYSFCGDIRAVAVRVSSSALALGSLLPSVPALAWANASMPPSLPRFLQIIFTVPEKVRNCVCLIFRLFKQIRRLISLHHGGQITLLITDGINFFEELIKVIHKGISSNLDIEVFGVWTGSLHCILKIPCDANFAQTLKARRPDSWGIDFKIRVVWFDICIFNIYKNWVLTS